MNIFHFYLKILLIVCYLQTLFRRIYIFSTNKCVNWTKKSIRIRWNQLSNKFQVIIGFSYEFSKFIYDLLVSLIMLWTFFGKSKYGEIFMAKTGMQFKIAISYQICLKQNLSSIIGWYHAVCVYFSQNHFSHFLGWKILSFALCLWCLWQTFIIINRYCDFYAWQTIFGESSWIDTRI